MNQIQSKRMRQSITKLFSGKNLLDEETLKITLKRNDLIFILLFCMLDNNFMYFLKLGLWFHVCFLADSLQSSINLESFFLHTILKIEDFGRFLMTDIAVGAIVMLMSSLARHNPD